MMLGTAVHAYVQHDARFKQFVVNPILVDFVLSVVQ
jgi:hypothetical protein